MSEWKTVRLGDVCEIAAGQGAPQGDSNYCDEGTPFVKAGNLIELIEGKSEKQIQKVSEEVAKSHKLKKYKASSILFAKSGMSCMKGYVYQLKNDCYVVSHLAIVKPKEDFSDYIEYCLRHIKPNTLVKDEAYPSISLQDISNLQIPLPPLETQKQIAAVLDKCTSLISKYKKILEKYDTLIKSRFIEMFGDPVTNPMGWEVSELQELVTEDCTISYGIVQTGELQKSGVRVFRPIDIVNRKPKLEELIITSQEISNKYKKTVLHGRELLITVRANIGDTCVIGEEFKGCNVGRGIVPIRTNENIISLDFLKQQFDTTEMNRLVKSLAKGITLIQLNMEDLRKIHLIVPPISLQNQFAAFVQQIYKSKFAVQKSLEKAETLYKSLMQEYFG